MASGLPVIASKIDGVSELLENGRLGILFEEKNVGELTNALLRFTKDETIRKEFAQKGKEASQNYTSSRMALRLQEVYERVIQKKK